MICKEQVIIMMQKWKNDLVLIAFIGIVLLLFWSIPLLFYNQKEAYVTIYQNGDIYFKGSLAEDNSISISDCHGNYNLILINNNTVKMSDAKCPDKLCIKQGNISKNGESIICLPNRVVIQITSEEESGLDTVTH